MADTELSYILEGSDDDDFLLCLKYVQWVEIDMKTQKSFAEEMGKAPMQLWRWKTYWTRSGLLEKVRSITGMAVLEDVKVANRKVVKRWPEVVDSLLDLALHATREDVRLSATKTLFDLIVKPEVEKAPNPGSAEAAYIEMIESKAYALEPMSVSVNKSERSPAKRDDVPVEISDDTEQDGEDDFDTVMTDEE